MKTILFILILCKALYSQQEIKKVEQITDSNLVRIFNNLSLVKIQEAPNFIIKIFSVDDEIDSTNRGSGEFKNQIYIAISDYNEFPLQKLYRLESLYSPRIETMEIAGEAVIILFSYIKAGERVSLRVIFSLKGASILKAK